jgi:lipoprotein-anchoring transpeptidase ErfK/SrfK
MKFRLLVLLTFFIFAGFFLYNNSPLGKPCANPGSCRESLTLNVDNQATGTFSGQKITPPKIDLAQKVDPKKILGEATVTGEKHIYVDLTTQTLSAYQGDSLFMQVPVSSGKWFPTPAGEYTIWEKIRATKMSGGEGADYYYLPNVPFVMFFEGSGVSAGRGFSLHGAYWHNNFGHPMSHGCVNMRTVDAEKLYYWVNPPTNGNVSLSSTDNPGTKITIYGKAP